MTSEDLAFDEITYSESNVSHYQCLITLSIQFRNTLRWSLPRFPSEFCFWSSRFVLKGNGSMRRTCSSNECCWVRFSICIWCKWGLFGLSSFSLDLLKRSNLSRRTVTMRIRKKQLDAHRHVLTTGKIDAKEWCFGIVLFYFVALKNINKNHNVFQNTYKNRTQWRKK